jgi:hypothetical protein
MSDDDVKRQSAVYADTTNRLRNTTELDDAAIDKIALTKVDESVYGFDAKRGRDGNYVQQGHGAPGHESANHFAAIRRYEGEESYRRAVAEIWKRDPKRAAALSLPQPART